MTLRPSRVELAIPSAIQTSKTTTDKSKSLSNYQTSGEIKLIFVNYLIIIFTLGIGTGIAINRVMRTVMENIEFDSEIDANSLMQTEAEYKDASGDDLAGMLDISIM